MRSSVLWLLVLCLAMGPRALFVSAGAEQTGNLRDLEQRLEELERQREELERQREEAERLQEMAEEFEDIQRESRERLEDYEERLLELKHEVENREEPLSAAEKLCIDAEVAYLEACTGVDTRLTALEGPEALPQARALLDELEVLEAQYDMVTEPRVQMALEAEQMALEAERLADPQCADVLERLKAAQQAYLECLEHEFELWKRDRELHRQIEELTDAFWAEVERAEREQLEE